MKMAEQTATLQTVPSLRSLAMNTAYKARCPQQNLFAVTSQKVSSLVHTKLAVLRTLRADLATVTRQRDEAENGTQRLLMKLEECEKELHRLVEKSESLASERGEALEMIAMLKEELEVANTETQRAKEQASKAEAEKVAEKAAREESAFQTALMVIRLEELCDEGKKQQKKDNEAWSQKLQETLEQANQQHQRACDILRTQNQALEQELETVRAEERNKLREVTEECERQKSLLRQAEHNYQARKKESEEKISIMEFQKLELGLERESLKRELQRHVNEKMSLEDSITRLEEKNYGLLGETKQLMEEKGLTISLHTSEDINERLLKEVVELKQEKDAMLQLFEEEIDALKDAKLLEEVEELKEEGFCAGEAKSLGTKVNKLKKEKEEASSQFKRPETETNRLQDELKSRFQKARAYIARLEEDKKLLLTEVMKVKKQMKKAAKDDQQSRMELARVVQKLRQELVDQKYLTDQKFKRLQQQPQFYKEQYEKRNAMVAEGVELRLNEMRRSPEAMREVSPLAVVTGSMCSVAIMLVALTIILSRY